MIGGALKGTAVKAVPQEAALVSLAQPVGAEGMDHVEYLQSQRNLHCVCHKIPQPKLLHHHQQLIDFFWKNV